MERNTFTIPAAGVTKGFKIRGKTLIIEDIAQFETAAKTPKVNFNGRSPIFPMYQGGQLPFWGDGSISEIRVTGTAESAGTEFTVFTVDQCLRFKLKGDYSVSYKPRYPVDQFTKSIAGGAIVTVSDLELQDSEGNLPAAVYIGATDFDIRYSYGADPTAARGFNLREDAEDPTKINSLELFQDMRFTNKDTGGTADATLNILPEFIG